MIIDFTATSRKQYNLLLLPLLLLIIMIAIILKYKALKEHVKNHQHKNIIKKVTLPYSEKKTKVIVQYTHRYYYVTLR